MDVVRRWCLLLLDAACSWKDVRSLSLQQAVAIRKHVTCLTDSQPNQPLLLVVYGQVKLPSIRRATWLLLLLYMHLMPQGSSAKVFLGHGSI